jgi:hypothetical protein
MVVYDPQDPYLSEYDVDDDSTVITLSDWYHAVSNQAGAVPYVLFLTLPISDTQVFTFLKDPGFNFDQWSRPLDW